MIVQINSVNYNPISPPCIERTLDESFDRAHMILKYITVSTPFEPFTPAYIDGEKWLIAQDDVTEAVGAGAKRFTHEIILVEETIALTTMLSSAKTFTKVLRAIEPDIPQEAPYRQTYTASEVVETNPVYTFTNPFSTPYYTDELTSNIWVPSINELISAQSPYTISAYNNGTGYYGIVITRNGSFASGQTATGGLESGLSISPVAGRYVIKYYFDTTSSGVRLLHQLTFEINIRETAATAPTDYTITDVVNTLLSTATPLRYGQTASITFDTAQAAKYSTVTAPEFSFSNGMSLWEMLLEVGKKIHGIPRLVNGVLKFDLLGGTTYAEIKGEHITNAESVSMERYCSAIEGIVDNVVSESKFTGSVRDPAYTTLRATTENVRINEESGLIQTLYPIESVTKIKCGYKQGTNARVEVGDITDYLYEKSLYNLLSSYGSTVGGSKSHAIYYSQGSRNIEGLFFKQPSVISGAFKQYAIANIIEAKTGTNVFNIWTAADYYNLDFEVTYIPIISVRARQHKAETGYNQAVIAYNQTADKVSSSLLGQAMRGQVAMMSSAEKSMTYRFNSLSDVPVCGTLYDDTYYISRTTTEIYPGDVKCTLSLQANYNRINKYVALPNKIRQFEVSEKNVYDRHILYEDYCVLGDLEGNNSALLTEIGRGFVATALDAQSNYKPIKTAIVTMLDKDLNNVAYSCVLPVIGLPFGNSILWSFAFEDNYSAGRKSSQADTGESTAYRVQEYVPYADYYGRAEYLNVAYYNYVTADAGYQTIVGHALPALPTIGLTKGALLATTGANPILVKKDGRERLLLTYQLHFVTNRDIIIGADFANIMSLVSEIASSSKARIYTYSTRINTFTGSTNTNGWSAAIVFGSHGGVPYVDCDAQVSGKSWAIIKDGKFMIGGNGKFKRIYFNFRHTPKEDITYSATNPYQEYPEVIEEEETPPDTYAITYNLSHMTASNPQATIAANASYYTVLTAASSYLTPTAVTVTRNGATLTAGTDYTYTKTGQTTATLYIPSPHNGNIVITGAAVQITSTLVLPYLDTNTSDSYFYANVGDTIYEAQDTTRLSVNMPYGTTVQLIWQSTTHYATVTIGAGGDYPYNITMTPTGGYAYYSFVVNGTIAIEYTATAIASTKSMSLEDTSNGTDFAAASQITVGIFYGDQEIQYIWNNDVADSGWQITGIPYNSVIRFYFTEPDGQAEVTIKNSQGQNAGHFYIDPETNPNQAIQITTNFYVTVVTTD